MTSRRYYGSIGTGSALELIARAQRLEAQGLDTLWSSQMHHTPFAPLAAIAGTTSKVHLGTAIALAFTRSPMETALTTLDMDRLTGGRFKLGLGAGVKRLNEQWHGVTDYGRPAPHLRECVELVRLLIERGAQGQPVTYAGRYYQIDLQGWRPRYEPLRVSIPIYVSGVGEGMARTAGDVADGMLGHPIWSCRWLCEVIAPNVRTGLSRSGRDRAAFDLSVSVPVLIAQGGAAGLRQARRDAAAGVAYYASLSTYQPVFGWHGFGRETERVRTATRAGQSDAAIDAVTDEMIDTFAVVGDVDTVRRRLEAYWQQADSMSLVIGAGVPALHAGEYEARLAEVVG